jgi:hypothetical protein
VEDQKKKESQHVVFIKRHHKLMVGDREVTFLFLTIGQTRPRTGYFGNILQYEDDTLPFLQEYLNVVQLEHPETLNKLKYKRFIKNVW